jgi:L-erythro-3,5-diaminohexanoate dehydrogenase
MQASSAADLSHQLGVDRVISPPGSLPQPADRLDASAPVRATELEISVERLCLDSTSHRNIRERSGGDPRRMADRILEIVSERGKMHNPETDSGGVLLGTAGEAGENFTEPPAPGDRVVTMSSLTLTPLRLDEVTHLDPADPQVEVRGTAYVFERASWAPLPEDIPLRTALEVLDVCTAGSHVRDLAPDASTIAVLGAGHAGKVAMAAARDANPSATVLALDVDTASLERVSSLGLCDHAISADLRDPVAAVESLRAAGAPDPDLTVVVVNTTGCEPGAILMTAPGGTVLFFSMATSFSAAALAGDGIGTEVRLLVGSGYAPDNGSYALDLVRASQPLRAALGVEP